MTTSTTSTTARATMLRRLQALLAKTTENGCTEAEAMSAMMLARKLMDDYQIDPANLHDEEWVDAFVNMRGAEADYTDKGNPKRNQRVEQNFWFRVLIASRVARFTDTHAWQQSDVRRIAFHGRASDAQFAAWLLDSLDAYALRAWKSYETAVAFDENFTADRATFLSALAKRINERLDDELLNRKAAHALEPGRALILRDRALVARDHCRSVHNLTSTHGHKSVNRDGGSAAAGHKAGDRASFGRPLAGHSAAPLRLK